MLWSTFFSRYVRSKHIPINMHVCQKKSIKYADANENAKKASDRAQASVCHFYFSMIVVIT